MTSKIILLAALLLAFSPPLQSHYGGWHSGCHSNRFWSGAGTGAFIGFGLGAAASRPHYREVVYMNSNGSYYKDKADNAEREAKHAKQRARKAEKALAKERAHKKQKKPKGLKT